MTLKLVIQRIFLKEHNILAILFIGIRVFFVIWTHVKIGKPFCQISTLQQYVFTFHILHITATSLVTNFSFYFITCVIVFMVCQYCITWCWRMCSCQKNWASVCLMYCSVLQWLTCFLSFSWWLISWGSRFLPCEVP